MKTYNEVPEVAIKPLNETKKASARRVMIRKNVLAMLIAISLSLGKNAHLRN